MSTNTPPDLRLILEVPGDVLDTSLQTFLDIASLVVTEDLSGAGMSAARLKQIELLLGAHFALLLTERGGLTSSRAGDDQDNYTSLSPLGNSAIRGYQLTRYGQQAMMLDSSGILTKTSNQKLPAKFAVIGNARDNGLGWRAGAC